MLDQILDLDGVRAVEGGPFVYLYFTKPDRSRVLASRDIINSQWNCGHASLPGEAPAEWKISASSRFPDLIVQANPGCAVISTSSMQHKMTAGDHGWPPEMPEMRGIFFAMGPRIPADRKLGVLRVTDIYPLMLAILELPAPGPIDGDPELLPSLLLPPD